MRTSGNLAARGKTFNRELWPSHCIELNTLRATALKGRFEEKFCGYQRIGIDELRPGGTVSGPVLMTVADAALYVAILGEIGIVPLAVTTSLTVNFLRKPSPDKDIIGVCKLIKLGKSLAVGEVSLYSEGDKDCVAHAVGIYSIPADVEWRPRSSERPLRGRR